MKSRAPLLGKILIGVGLAILMVQGALHLYTASQGKLRAFDEDGERVVVPFIGTICTTGGLFLLALSGGGSGRKES